MRLYDQPEFLGFRDRLLNYDVFTALETMIKRLDGG